MRKLRRQRHSNGPGQLQSLIISGKPLSSSPQIGRSFLLISYQSEHFRQVALGVACQTITNLDKSWWDNQECWDGGMDLFSLHNYYQLTRTINQHKAC